MVSGVTMHAQLCGRQTQTNTDKLTFNYAYEDMLYANTHPLHILFHFYYFYYSIFLYCYYCKRYEYRYTTFCWRLDAFSCWLFADAQCELQQSISSTFLEIPTRMFGFNFYYSEIRGKILLSTNSSEFQQ